MAYRVIGSDGLERELGTLAEWVAAIRSGAVDDEGLFWNGPEGRWVRIADLKVYGEAKAAAHVNGAVSEAEPKAAPLPVGDPGRAAAPEPARPPGDATIHEGSRPRRRGTTLAMAVVILALILAALWWAGGVPTAPEAVLARIPWQARVGAAILIGLVLAEEFYWIALGILGIRGSTFPARFIVQASSAGLTALALCAVSRNPDYFGRWFAWMNQRYGTRMEPGFFDRLVAALAIGDVKSALVLAFVQHAVLLGGLYACAVLATSALLLRIDIVRNLFASLLVSAMIFGTLYMALAPTAPAPPRRGTGQPPEVRSTSASPALRHRMT